MRLRRSDWHSPGIRRRRRGKGFSYYWDSGDLVTDRAVRDRIAELAIPPAWADVWICPWPQGHIQAVGTDDAGRRQYRYHDAWRELRDRQKFDRVLEFGQSLPALRHVVEQHLAGDAPTRERVLAGAVRLLDLGFFRIGGEQYAQENETFGLATLQKDHLTLRSGSLVFDYPAKGSIQRIVTVSDPEVYRLMQSLRRRRGGCNRLLAYKERGRWHELRSDDVNTYIHEGSSDAYTAKDFRTWSATVLGAVELAKSAPDSGASRTRRTKASRRAVTVVAEYLGNTPAVCRASYIDPWIFERFNAGMTIAETLDRFGQADLTDWAIREEIESAVIELISDRLPDQRAA